MKNFIGGLFNNRKEAARARRALRENGLEETSINMLLCTHEKEAVVLEKNPSIKSIGKSALTGAMILGGIGGVIGLLVGLGIIPFPSLEPSGGQTLPFQITWQFVFSATAAGVLLGGFTDGRHPGGCSSSGGAAIQKGGHFTGSQQRRPDACRTSIALDNEALRVLQMCGLEENAIDTVAIPDGRLHSPVFGQYSRAVTTGSIDGHPRLVTFFQPQLETVLRERLARSAT